MLEAHQLPSPYLLGVQTEEMPVIEPEMKDVVVVDLDSGKIKYIATSIITFPTAAGTQLRQALMTAYRKWCVKRDDGVPDGIKADYDLFDVEVHSAVWRFFAEVLTGYRKYSFFVDNVPFFNGAGFLKMKVSTDAKSQLFYEKFITSRAFNMFLQDEGSPDIFHEVIQGQGLRSDGILATLSDLARKAIPLHDIPAPAKLAQPPKPSPSSVIGDSGVIADSVFPLKAELFGPTRSRGELKSPGKRKLQNPMDDGSPPIINNNPEQRIKAILAKVFASIPLNVDERKEMKILSKHKIIRTSLNTTLQQSTRGSSAVCLTPESFHELVDIIGGFIDCCEAAGDVVNGMTMLDSCAPFNTEDRGDAIRYVEAELRLHPFYQKIEYWKSNLEHQMIARAKELKRSGASWNDRVRDEFISQWAHVAIHRMLRCGIAQDVVRKCMEDLYRQHDVAQALISDLENFIKKSAPAIHQLNQQEAPDPNKGVLT